MMTFRPEGDGSGQDDDPNDDDVMWIHRSDGLSWREVEGEIIVLDLRQADYLRLNPSGAVLWVRLETGATKSDLVRLLVDHFGLATPKAQVDVVAFLKSCLDKQLIEPRQMPGPPPA